MAEGGESVDDSVDGNEFFNDFPCIPCQRDGKDLCAIKYCVDCDENLCSPCLKQHSKFALNQRHKILDDVKTCHGRRKELPSQRCTRHGGKVMDAYCPTHDTVGCTLCVAVDHKSCEGIKYVPDVAKGIKSSDELQRVEAEMKTLKTRLDSLKTRKQTNVESLKQDKDALQQEIQLVRKKLNDQLDKMETELLEESETKFNQRIQEIDATIADIDAALEQIKDTMKQLSKDNQESDIFVTCKLGIRDNFAKVEELENINPVHSMELQTDEMAQLIMEGKRLFAVLIDKYDTLEVEHQEDINVRFQDDIEVCTISGICSLPDGSLAITDVNNKRLKKIDQLTHSVTTLLTLTDSPWGICVVDDTTVAVSLCAKKEIQFVSLSDPVKLSHCFSVGDVCSGLSHFEGLLYVCCGGWKGSNLSEGTGHVDVYSCDGQLLKCMYEGLGRPVFISVTNEGQNTRMYISDCDQGVQVRSLDGAIKHTFSTRIPNRLPFCLIGMKHTCIGEASLKTISLHTPGDKHVVVDKADLNGSPCTLYFDERSAQLIVGMFESDILKVFKIKM